jgi:hypothetical protein
MRFVLRTELDCPPRDAILNARRTRLFEYVCAPWVRVEPLEPPALPDEWEAGRYRVRMRLFGLVPLGAQWIAIRVVAQRGDRLLVHDQGSGTLVRVWDHRIEITPAASGGTRYCDRLRIEAGWRTPFVVAFARLLFAHRQRRWQRLVRNKFDYDA